MVDAAEVVEAVDEDLAVVVHEDLVEAVMQEIEEDSTALPVLVQVIATNGPEVVAVGSQPLKN